MSDKIIKIGSKGEILDGDLMIRRTFPAGLDNAPGPALEVIATIEVVGGFECFNTVPYHNYECWGQGYRVTAGGVSVTSEYLDDALAKWAQAKKVWDEKREANRELSQETCQSKAAVQVQVKGRT